MKYLQKILNNVQLVQSVSQETREKKTVIYFTDVNE